MADNVKYAVRSHVVFVGTGLSGLVAGAILAKSGKKVIILPEEMPSEVKQSQHPFVPQLLCLGLERDGVIDRIFNEIGTSIPLLKRAQNVFKKESPYLQILMPFHRFNMDYDWEETLDGLKIGFKENSQNLRKLFDKTDELYPLIYPFLFTSSARKYIQKGEVFNRLLQWATYKLKILKFDVQKGFDFCKGLEIKDDPIDFLNALSVYYYQTTIDKITTLDLFKLFIFLKNEPVSVISGLSGLKELFLKVIKENKGEIWNAVPTSFHFLRNRITGVEFRGKDPLGCDVLILNPEAENRRKNNSNTIFSCYFYIPEEVIPPMMGEFLILKLDPLSPFHESNFLFVSLECRNNSKTKEGEKHDRKRGLLAQCLIQRQSGLPSTDRLIKQIEQQLIWFLPFGENKMEYQSCIMREPKEWNPPYLTQEMIKKFHLIQGEPLSIASFGRSTFCLFHDQMGFFISPFLIKRGGDMANIIKKDSVLKP